MKEKVDQMVNLELLSQLQKKSVRKVRSTQWVNQRFLSRLYRIFCV